MFHRTLLDPQLSPHFSTPFPTLAPSPTTSPLPLYPSAGPSTATLQRGLCFGRLAEQFPSYSFRPLVALSFFAVPFRCWLPRNLRGFSSEYRISLSHSWTLVLDHPFCLGQWRTQTVGRAQSEDRSWKVFAWCFPVGDRHVAFCTRVCVCIRALRLRVFAGWHVCPRVCVFLHDGVWMLSSLCLCNDVQMCTESAALGCSCVSRAHWCVCLFEKMCGLAFCKHTWLVWLLWCLRVCASPRTARTKGRLRACASRRRFARGWMDMLREDLGSAACVFGVWEESLIARRLSLLNLRSPDPLGSLRLATLLRRLIFLVPTFCVEVPPSAVERWWDRKLGHWSGTVRGWPRERRRLEQRNNLSGNESCANCWDCHLTCFMWVCVWVLHAPVPSLPCSLLLCLLSCERGTPLTWWSVGLVWWKGEAEKRRWERTGAVASMGSLFDMSCPLRAWVWNLRSIILICLRRACAEVPNPLGHASSDDHSGQAAEVTGRGGFKSHSLASTLCYIKYIATWEDCRSHVGTLRKWRRWRTKFVAASHLWVIFGYSRSRVGTKSQRLEQQVQQPETLGGNTRRRHVGRLGWSCAVCFCSCRVAFTSGVRWISWC